jgi:5-(carboxyamino)imidazole ribonucleotide synthase
MITVLPPATIGMLGGGQLGRFALMAARSMGYRCVVLDPDPRSPAGVIADEHLVAGYDDPSALDRLALACEVVTTEFENPPAQSLERLSQSVLVAPSARAVSIAQDRIAEKQFLIGHGFEVGPWVEVFPGGPPVSLARPSVLKTARLGYDGKGQRRVDTTAELHAAWAELGGVACVLEDTLEISTEVSVVVARTADARVACFEVAENRHVNGILDITVVPARVDPELADRAVGLAMAVADALDYVGVLSVEFFIVGDRVLINEIAPRPHNSGHWTLDGARTSQFEQQIRAVCGLGLGSTALTVGGIAMVNLLGDLWTPTEPDWSPVLEHPEAKLHLYGKYGAKPGRKMGHLTVMGHSPEEAEMLALQLRSSLETRR